MQKYKNQNLFSAMLNAYNGLLLLIKEKSVIREILLIIVIGIIFLWHQNIYTLLLLALGFALISVECINTSIELLCDHLSPSYHPDIKKVKDLGAAAVLIILLGIATIFMALLFYIY